MIQEPSITDQIPSTSTLVPSTDENKTQVPQKEKYLFAVKNMGDKIEKNKKLRRIRKERPLSKPKKERRRRRRTEDEQILDFDKFIEVLFGKEKKPESPEKKKKKELRQDQPLTHRRIFHRKRNRGNNSSKDDKRKLFKLLIQLFLDPIHFKRRREKSDQSGQYTKYDFYGVDNFCGGTKKLVEKKTIFPVFCPVYRELSDAEMNEYEPFEEGMDAATLEVIFILI